MRKIVKITDSVYAQHAWPNCDIEMSSFLRNHHVHKMFITVEVLVTDSNREVEFFVLRRDLLEVIKLFPKMESEVYDLGSHSMEMVAEIIYNELIQMKYNVWAVECSEDGYFSGRVEQ